MLFDIDDDKGPEPDGFGQKFYKNAWDMVGDDVVEEVMEFFRSGKLLKQWNHAFIDLCHLNLHMPLQSMIIALSLDAMLSTKSFPRYWLIDCAGSW